MIAISEKARQAIIQYLYSYRLSDDYLDFCCNDRNLDSLIAVLESGKDPLVKEETNSKISRISL